MISGGFARSAVDVYRRDHIMLDREYDALVVGARVAGSTVAALLGDAGYHVLLVDKATFPSTTRSTHFFSNEGLVAVLARLKLLDGILALGCPPLAYKYLYNEETERRAAIPVPSLGDIGFELSVRREPLDSLLVQRALSSPSVDLVEQARVTALLWEHERVVGARLLTPQGAYDVRTRIVIGADGRHSFVARAVNAPLEESAPSTRAIYYRYVSGFLGPDGISPNGSEYSLLGDELAYVFPSDAGLTCLALSINLADFAWMRTKPEERFVERLAQHRGIADRFLASQPVGPFLGCGPEVNYVRVPAGPGWALVGDAGLHQDPCTGLGMDMASTHASFLAEALCQWFDGGLSQSEALASYHQRRNEQALEDYRRTVYLARDLRKWKSFQIN
jgi:2-polyprenyl-6-methoxyphenol hydroxylase-like FAD-dependent oxidoreductase